jgi:hypothetical protein
MTSLFPLVSLTRHGPSRVHSRASSPPQNTRNETHVKLCVLEEGLACQGRALLVQETENGLSSVSGYPPECRLRQLPEQPDGILATLCRNNALGKQRSHLRTTYTTELHASLGDHPV